MKVTLYCGDGQQFWVAATERDEMGLAAGRIPAIGEAVIPPGGCDRYRVVFVCWQLGADAAVEVVAVRDDSWEPIQMTIVPPPPK